MVKNTKAKYFQNLNLPHGKSYFLISIILTFILTFGFWSMMMFIPELILPNNELNFGRQSLFWAFNNAFLINQTDKGLFAAGVISWVISSLNLLIILFLGWTLIRGMLLFIFYSKWYQDCLDGHTKIIESCDISKITDKVAMVVPTCNDFLPNTVLQTAKQTYKNMDVWISDDSSKPEVIARIDAFCKEHGFNVIHRDPQHKKEHPTKVGNLFYFLQKVGDNYDYVFENDSSSIVTSTFVEHCMCYFKTPLWNHDKDGGIISNGSFFGAKNLISYLNSKAIQMSESMMCGGGANQLLGGPVMINGWGAMYKISTLKKIPLEDVECPICDSARGLWLTLNGYQNYLNPFDFTAKWSPQTVEGLKNQKLKWNGGDVFIFRNGLINSRYPYWKTNIYVKTFAWPIDIIIPLGFVLVVINAVISLVLNFLYFNLTSIIVMGGVGIVMAVILLIIMYKKRAPFILLILSAFASLVDLSIMYRRVWQIVVRGFIRKTWSSSAVTVKANQKTTFKQKLRMCRFDAIFVLVGLIACLLIQFLIKPMRNPFIVWFTTFGMLTGPSILYILLVFIGEIPVSVGYDDKMIEYNFWLHDFRYRYVSQTKIWKDKHKLE